MNWIEKHLKALTWTVVALAYAFLLYKLLVFDDYELLATQWKESTSMRWWWLTVVLLLLPLNWALEAIKWKTLLIHLEKISFIKALKSVLVGITAGFFTPNRLGEYPGRTLLLSNGNRLSATELGFVGTAAQTLCILMAGLPSVAIFFIHFAQPFSFSSSLWIYFLLSVVVFGVGFFILPTVAKRLLSRKTFGIKLTQLLQSLAQLSFKQMFRILFLSLLRYVVFCSQLLAMLHFFGIDIALHKASIAIAANYLFVTLTPSMAFSEVAVRGSFAIVFLGAFSANTVAIASASISLWVVNYCLPMLAGSFLLASSQE